MGDAGGMASPLSKKMTKSIPSVKPPSPLTIPFGSFCVLRKTYHTHEMLKFSTFDDSRTK